MTERYVVDASVAVKLFFAEAHSDKAADLFERLNAPEPIAVHVPDAFYYEVIAALRKRALSASDMQIRNDAADLLALNLVVAPTRDLLLHALDISLSHAVSFYDALYLALAAGIEAPLITADERLARAVQGKSFDVRTLAGLDLTAL